MSHSSLLLYAAALILLLMATTAESADCDYLALTAACRESYYGGGTAPQCCAKIKEQETCFCDYMKDPAHKEKIMAPEGRRLFAACNVPFPNCSSA